MSARRILGQTAALLAASLVCAVVSNALAGSERRLAWRGDPQAAATAREARTTAAAGTAPASPSAPPAAGANAKSFPPHPDTPWTEISTADAQALFSRDDVLFLDARRTSVYREGHIAGARVFSVWEADVDDKVKALFAEGRDQSAPIVVYCSGGECEDSHMLGQKLYMAGFDNVLVYRDGFPAWEKRGLPVTKGDKP